jgi:GNAT superfamily N-acetyltransferase
VLIDHAAGTWARTAQRDAAVLDSRVHGIEPLQVDGLLIAPTGVPHEQWNGAWFTGVPDDLIGVLDSARERFRSLGVPYGLVVPLDLAPVLGGWLSAAGAGYRCLLPLMERSLDTVPVVFRPPGVRIRQASGMEDYRALARVQAVCFGDGEPLWSRYLRARYDHPEIVDFLAVTNGPHAGPAETVVGTGTLVVTGEAAGVYGIGVIPPWRRQGIGAALTAALLSAAARLGCQIAPLNPSEAGARTYRRLGFRDVDGFHVWSPPD